LSEGGLIAAIQEELDRIGAGEAAGGPDTIGVNDERDGWASLGATEQRHDFYWYGTCEEILRRLSGLPGGAGPGAVRDEFHTDLPPRLGGDEGSSGAAC
jgi:hypothetical protein